MRRYFTGENFMLLLFFSLFMAIVMSRFEFTWDDSAITIAFSKTLALTGDIRPSVYSDRVEGYSSFLWMMLNCLFFKAGAGENTALLLSKTLALFFNVLTAFLLYRLLKQRVKNIFIIFLGLFSFLFSSASLFESINGMETPLYAFLLLQSFAAFEKMRENSRMSYVFIAASSLFILVRHEAAWYLAPFLIIDLYNDGGKVFKKSYPYIWLTVFLSYNVWHYNYFSEFLTNPMIAKKNAPYTPDFENSFEYIKFHAFPLILIITDNLQIIWAAFAFDRFSVFGKKEDIKFENRLRWDKTLLFVVFGLVFNVIIGTNWGPKGRMFMPALPFLILYFAGVFDRKEKPLNAANLLPVFLFAAFFCYMNTGFFVKLAGEQMQVRGFKTVWNSVENLMHSAGLEKLTYAGPDMGGFLLFSKNLRVTDTALLCSRHLARNGYKAFGEYIFEKEKPGVIKTHVVWTFLSRVYDDERFYRDYRPVICTGTKLFLSKNIFDGLQKKGLLKSIKIPVIYESESPYAKYDNLIYEKFGSCYELESRP